MSPGALVTGEKGRKKQARQRSFHMPLIVKRLRLVFYMLAMVELVLMSVVWGSLAVH